MRYEINQSESTPEPLVCTYLTDSSETERVRSPIAPGPVELRCAVVSRAMARDERALWRNAGVLPGGIGVDPQVIECVVTAPDGSKSTPTVEQLGDGMYSAALEASSVGNWIYRFIGSGGCSFSEERTFSVL